MEATECRWSGRPVAGGFRVTAGERELFIERLANLEELWEKMGADDFADERIPYWAELWPSSLVLAEWLAERDLAGKYCVDLGCGVGLTALAGVERGAKVVAADYEFDALAHCRRNAIRNGENPPLCLLTDWRFPSFRPNSIDLVWGADIVYERRAAAPICDFLLNCLKPGGVAWLAEPGRGVFSGFPDLLTDFGFVCAPVARRIARSLDDERRRITVTVWEARKAGSGNKRRPASV